MGGTGQQLTLFLGLVEILFVAFLEQDKQGMTLFRGPFELAEHQPVMRAQPIGGGDQDGLASQKNGVANAHRQAFYPSLALRMDDMKRLFPVFFTFLLMVGFLSPAPKAEEFANQEELDSFFLLAVGNNNLEKAEERLKLGANPNAKDRIGQTALFTATLQKMNEMAGLLLDHGADPNLPSLGGATPLQMAAYLEAPVIVDLLLKKGAKLDLLSAVRLGKTAEVTAMLKAKANPNMVGPLGATPLTMVKDPAVADLLLKKGAKPNLKGVMGSFPIHTAAETGSLKLVQVLVKGGAKPGQTNAKGQKAADIASEKGFMDVAGWLNAQKQ